MGGIAIISGRNRWEELERSTLSQEACLSANTRGREREEPPCPLRTCFQVDRDRIIHSKSFRRLKHKTQVLLLPEGDHYRTRLTHTLEVSQIARTIARCLRLNEDLTEAIALGHDLGHTPFGHMGERILDRIARSQGKEGFHHASQSLRVVERLEKEGKGLNLTAEVRQGILQHSKGQTDVRQSFGMDRPSTLEAWVVRISDSIAYLNHDLDDALRAGFLSLNEIPSIVLGKLGKTHGDRIGKMVEDVVANSGGTSTIVMGEDVLEAVEELRNTLYRKVYASRRVLAEEPKVEHVLKTLFDVLIAKPDKKGLEGIEPDPVVRALDFLSGMTDRYALQFFDDVAKPSPWPYF
ncbi:MAG: deoxyguanosinetriphosphate triphosphohydrolase [Synergistales bacterium]